MDTEVAGSSWKGFYKRKGLMVLAALLVLRFTNGAMSGCSLCTGGVSL